MPRTKRAGPGKKHKIAHSRKSGHHAGKRKVLKVKAFEAPRASFSTADRDAQLRELRKEYKHELAEIMSTARRRRERAKPRKFQEILIWEMGQIRHAESKYRAAMDKLMKGIPVSDEEHRKRAPGFTATAPDKKPSPKQERLK